MHGEFRLLRRLFRPVNSFYSFNLRDGFRSLAMGTRSALHEISESPRHFGASPLQGSAVRSYQSDVDLPFRG
jgi:hypothetical protein